MDTKIIKKTSKFLSLVLRHRPELINIDMDEAGWVNTDELIEKSNKKGQRFDMELLEEVVRNNNKKRFSFKENKTKIRANQGHSVNVNLGYTPVEPPEILYHGTATRFEESIRRQGLLKQNRHAVHLSADKATALNVGSRQGKPILLLVKAGEMNRDGHDFFLSDNGVWLTDHVPSRYLEG